MRLVVPLMVLLASCGPKAVSPEPAGGGTTSDGELPFDPGVRRGQLDNGMKWFIETNGVPDDRVVLRLVVETGSVLEDDDQLGLAHFVEHMAFNGTTNFPGNSLITKLEGFGTRFGPHINAHTSFDETVYKLQLPTDDPAIVDTGFVILGDWAGGLTFDADEIEAERGVVLEEWRQRLGAGKRVSEQLFPLTFHESRYTDRLPIGTEESLKNFDHEALKRFYTDWYRPELMSVIVVGDVDPDAMQAKIEATFGGLKNPEKPRERVRPEVPPHADPLVKVVTDPEIPVANLGLLHKMDDIESNTHEGYRESLTEQLAITMFNLRLAEIAQQQDAPFLGAGMGKQRITPTEGLVSTGAAARETEVPAALRALWTEVERIRRHGFTEPELERARKTILKGYERYLIEQETTQSVTHAEELIRHVTTGEPVPGIAYEVELARKWLPDIGADEAQAWFVASMKNESRVLTAVLPQKPGLTPPTEDELLAILAEVEASEVAPPAEEGEVADPVSAKPELAAITDTDTTYQESLGFTGWTLENGVEVWFKKTAFKQDQVSMTGFRPGGHRHISDETYVRTVLASGVKGSSGIGALSNTDLMKWMAGRSMSARFFVTASEDRISGGAAPDDVDAALSLVWQGMTDPRITADGRDLVLKQQRVSLKNRDSQPGAKLSRALAEALWPDTPRRHPWTLEQVEGALSDVEQLDATFQQHFSDASGFQFVFVGNLPDDFETSVRRWLGNLPVAEGERPERAPVALARKAGPHNVVVKANSEAKAQVRMTWYAPFEDQKWETRNRLTAVDEVLSTRLREELREKLGGVYGVGVGSNTTSDWPSDEASLSVSFTCDPERVEELKAAALAVVESLRTQPVESRYIEEIQAKRTRQREEQEATNGFWMSTFAGALGRGEDPRGVLDYGKRNASLSPEVVQKAAARFLPKTEPNVVSVLLPSDEN